MANRSFIFQPERCLSADAASAGETSPPRLSLSRLREFLVEDAHELLVDAVAEHREQESEPRFDDDVVLADDYLAVDTWVGDREHVTLPFAGSVESLRKQLGDALDLPACRLRRQLVLAPQEDPAHTARQPI